MEKDTVFFKLESGERKKLKSDAHAHGMNVSEYLRWLIGIERIKMSGKKSEVEENMLPELCSCGYRFEADETICSNCGKKVEEDG